MAQTNRPQAETLSGLPQPNFTGYEPRSILAKRAPTTSDTGYPIGQGWVDTVGDNAYTLVDVSAGAANWAITGGVAAGVQTVNNLLPSSGNITIAGTASQVATSNAGSTVTLSLTGPYAPKTFTADGVLYGNGASAIGVTTSGSAGQVLTSNGAGFAPTFQASAGGGVATLTGDSGGAISPTAGNINTLGTANQITTTGAGSTLTWSLPASVVTPGSLTTTTSLTAHGAVTLADTGVVNTSIGNVNGNSNVTISAGTGGFAVGTVNGGIAINSGTGDINVSTDLENTNINIGTNAGAIKNITFGTNFSTSAVTFFSGTGGMAFRGADAQMLFTCGAGPFNVSTDATNTTLNIGTGAGNKIVNVGSTTGTATTTIQSGSGNINLTNSTVVTGNVSLSTAGNKLSIASGANASVGTSGALTAGTITISTSAVTASSLFFFTTNTLGTVTLPQAYYAKNIIPGTSFDIQSAGVTDTSTVNWWIIN